MIYRPHHIYLIHIDARQDYLFRSLLHLELEFTNIRLTRRRESSIWGGVSLLDVLIDSMSQLLDMGSKWQFVLNLSESDFPLRSIDSLEAFLAANKDRNFLKSHGRQTRQFIHKQGLDRVFHQCESRMWRVGDRTLPQGIRFDGGSDWIAITRSLAQYIVHQNNPLLQGYNSIRYSIIDVLFSEMKDGQINYQVKRIQVLSSFTTTHCFRRNRSSTCWFSTQRCALPTPMITCV